MVAVLMCFVLAVPITLPLGVLYQIKASIIYVAAGALVSAGQLQLLSRRTLLAMILIGGAATLLLPWSFIAALGGIAATLAIAICLKDTTVGQTLKFLGGYSLEIFLCHTMASASIRIALSSAGIANSGTHILLGIAVGLLAPIGLSILFRMLDVRFAFTLPRRTTPADAS